MNDLEEARNALETPIKDSFDVHLSKFMERFVFFAANYDTFSPVEIIRTLTKSIKNLAVLQTWRFDSMNLSLYPAGRDPDRGRGRDGRCGRGGCGTPYVKVFVDPSFISPACTKCCWCRGYKVVMALNAEMLILHQRKRVPRRIVKLSKNACSPPFDVCVDNGNLFYAMRCN